MKSEDATAGPSSSSSSEVGAFVLGLGFSTVKKGDLVCVLFGCKAPCILRLKTRTRDGDASGGSTSTTGEERYKVVGMCFAPSTGSRERSDTPQRFVLV